MTRVSTDWFKSSFSNPESNCVEVRFDGGAVRVRDSKQGGTGPVMTVAASDWARFLAAAAGSTNPSS